MGINKRTKKRVALDQAFNSALIGIDGTWQKRCRIEDISDSGARIKVFQPIGARMRDEEFFLVVTDDAKVRRRSKLVWTKNTSAGLAFVTAGSG